MISRQTQGYDKYDVLTVSERSLDTQTGKLLYPWTGSLYLQEGAYLWRHKPRSTDVELVGKVVRINRGLHPRGDFAQVFVERPSW